MRARSLSMARALTGATALLAIASAIGAAPATAHHEHVSAEDAPAWDGAGSGWNGGSWRHAARGSTPDTWTPAATAEVSVRDLAISRPAISPNGDREGDVAWVSFGLRRTSAPVQVRVLDAAGMTVRTLGEVRRAGSWGRFAWDGTTDGGATASDGAYRIVLVAIEQPSARHDGAGSLAVGVTVDTRAPRVSARRPTLMQLRALARRAGKVRDERRRWAARLARRGNGWRRRTARHGNGNGHHRDNGTRGWSEREQAWVRLWESRQLRLPVRFTTAEDGDVTITARVGARATKMATWRAAGSHTLDVVLPAYASGARLTLTFLTSDDAGNAHRHTVVSRLPAMPRPAPLRRTWSGGDRSGGGATPVTGVPTSTGGPFPDWLDPIMLRATYGAGVPQSWARSQALANLVFRESSYRPTAQNPTSTAYGLFQFLDQTWATVGCRKTSDAYQQSVCGLRYVQRRYRTPERAWAFWQANHWY